MTSSPDFPRPSAFGPTLAFGPTEWQVCLNKSALLVW